ncbi:MAG TPA: hypothetical protein VIP07_05275 [Candidatus Limnocylindria bacterium]|jgi:hypothetical protein
MLWLAWRQHRIMLIGLMVVASVLAIAIALAAAFAARTRIELGVDTCVPLFNTNRNCVDLADEWSRRVGSLRYLGFALYLVPALVGSYVGGPLLARELERGTHRLAWTQGIGRIRWAATILEVVLAVTLAAGVVLAFGGGQSWPLLGVSTFRPFDIFDLEGPALVSYMIFGLAIGAFVGAWRRRILSGMFYGLVVFALVRGLVITELRPNYEPPRSELIEPTLPLVGLPPVFPPPSGSHIPADAWTVGTASIDGQGQPVTIDRVRAMLDAFSRAGCPALAGRNCDSTRYLNENGVYQYRLYQPADRFWRFQLYEAGLYLLLTAALVAGTLVMLRRRDA